MAPTPTIEATLSIEIVCDECGRARSETDAVFLAMDPKVDTDVPFYLCPKCWVSRDGFDGPEDARGGRVLEGNAQKVVAVAPPPRPKEVRDGRKRAARTGSRHGP
jgi:hypothetical protein